MALPKPLPQDDDPFAVDFGDFASDEAFAASPDQAERPSEPELPAEPAVSPDAVQARAFDADAFEAQVRAAFAASAAEAEQHAPQAAAGEDDALELAAPATVERLPVAPDAAPVAAGSKAFDWFGHFRKSEKPQAGSDAPGVSAPVAFAPVEPQPTPHEPASDAFEAAVVAPVDWDEEVSPSAEALAAPEPFAGDGAISPAAEAADAMPALESLPQPLPEAGFDFVEDEAQPQPSPVAAMIASAEAALGDAVVPRIAIHVFCQKAETAAVAQAAAADRRLQRASTAVRPGGLPEALALYATAPTPALVIVENLAPAMQLLADLDRLAEVCDPGTKVVVIGEANDITLYRELMRRGVSEYLVPPLQPLQLIRTISGLYADPDTPFVGRTIAFVGAKGGVGASTLAHNFAWCLAERIEAATCVVDYDLPFGTAGLDFNQDPVNGLHDALSKPDRMDAVLMDRMMSRCTERLSLFAAPATLDDDYDIAAEAYEEVGGKIRSAAPYVVLDLPHVWSAWMRRTLISADDVVLVAQPDLASLRNGKNLVEMIGKSRPNDAPPRLVLNQVGLPGRPEIPVKDFAKAMGMEPALTVPFDAKLFGQAANNGQMIGEVNDKARASEGLLQFAQALTRREAAAPKPKSLIDRLVKRG